jgi:hypothetical protein
MADDDFDIDLDDEGKSTPEPDEDDEDKGESGKSKPSDDERERMRRSIKAARKERDDTRRELAEMRKELAALKTGGDGGKDTSKDDAARDRDADERAFARYRPVLVKSAAEAALVRAGAKPDRVARLVRLLDADEVNVDEKGTVDNDDLTAEVDRLKEDMPELFKGDDEDDDRPQRKSAPRGGRRDAAARPSGSKTPSSTARLAAALTGGSRR